MGMTLDRPPLAASKAALHLGALVLAVLLAACSSTPTRDGPAPKPPPNIEKMPDAQPQIEPIREGGPNKPYALGGRRYTPIDADEPLTEKGLASWYGRKFHGRRTAGGEVYNMYAMTAAHKTMPLPSYARVRNPANGREIIVRVNDRGPFHKGRIIDLSYAAAMKLGVHNGVAPVEVERITHEQIRNGTWRRDGSTESPPETLAVAPAVKVIASTPPVPVSVPAPEPDAPPIAAATPAARGFWVQIGAFRQRNGAEQFQRRVSEDLQWLSPLLAIFSEPQLFRLQAGPYPTRDEADEAAGRIREALKLVPVVTERR
jgi:rare lipoprotein A